MSDLIMANDSDAPVEVQRQSAVAEAACGKSLEIDDLLARPRLSGLQLGILTVCFLAAVIDGADRQGIGLVTVNLITALHMSAANMGCVLAFDGLGAVIGTLIGGRISDRYGRKPVMVLTLVVMAVATWITPFSGSFLTLATVRFIAGLGLGGAIPAFLTLSSEYVARPRRGAIAALVFAGYPVGGAVGGLWTHYLLKDFSWQSVFYIGAILPGLLLLPTIFFLPESLQYLARGSGSGVRALRVARRIAPELHSQDFFLCEKRPANPSAAGSFRALLMNDLAMPTLFLWGIYFFLFATTKVAVAWLPAILSFGGIPQSSVALVFGVWNVGAVAGQLSVLKIVDRARSTGLFVAALVTVAIAIGTVSLVKTHLMLVATAIACAGLGVGVATSSVIAIATNLYEAQQRGVGMGSAQASSRFGQVVSPLMISWLIGQAFGINAIIYMISGMPLVAAGLVLLFEATPLRKRLVRH